MTLTINRGKMSAMDMNRTWTLDQVAIYEGSISVCLAFSRFYPSHEARGWSQRHVHDWYCVKYGYGLCGGGIQSIWRYETLMVRGKSLAVAI